MRAARASTRPCPRSLPRCATGCPPADDPTHDREQRRPTTERCAAQSHRVGRATRVAGRAHQCGELGYRRRAQWLARPGPAASRRRIAHRARARFLKSSIIAGVSVLMPTAPRPATPAFSETTAPLLRGQVRVHLPLWSYGVVRSPTHQGRRVFSHAN